MQNAQKFLTHKPICLPKNFEISTNFGNWHILHQFVSYENVEIHIAIHFGNQIVVLPCINGVCHLFSSIACQKWHERNAIQLVPVDRVWNFELSFSFPFPLTFFVATCSFTLFPVICLFFGAASRGMILTICILEYLLCVSVGRTWWEGLMKKK